MLRVAVWYENRLGRNDGNPLYVLASLKRMEDRKLLEVDHLIPDQASKPEMNGKYDAHIWVDWGEDGLTGILPYQPTFPPGRPFIYWASDTHLGYDYRLKCAKEADIAFVAQKKAVDEFKRDGVKNPLWLPHAVEPMAYCDVDSVLIDAGTMIGRGNPKPYDFLTKTYDVSFVGHINSGNRIDALDRLFREFPNFFYGQRLFNEASEIYARSKVTFNISMKDDLNMRVFEALCSKTLLLTNYVPTIDELFEDGKHLVLYRNMDEAIEKARYYIEHDEEREKIAQAGYEEVIKNHTIDHRVNRMLEEVKNLVLV